MANRIWNIDGNEITGSDGAVLEWEDNRFFTLSFNGNSFLGEVLEESTESNFLKLKLNHRVFEIRKKGVLDDLISAMGLDVPKVKKLKEIEAPMPGRIVNIAVKIGQKLNVGDDILSLEAMKMENVLTAPVDCSVSSIEVKIKETVEKNTLLIKFDLL